MKWPHSSLSIHALLTIHFFILVWFRSFASFILHSLYIFAFAYDLRLKDGIQRCCSLRSSADHRSFHLLRARHCDHNILAHLHEHLHEYMGMYGRSETANGTHQREYLPRWFREAAIIAVHSIATEYLQVRLSTSLFHELPLSFKPWSFAETFFQQNFKQARKHHECADFLPAIDIWFDVGCCTFRIG